MRQFFSVRFWLTLAALVALALLVSAIAASQRDDSVDDSEVVTTAGHRLDLVTWAYSVVPGEGFAMVDGRTTADLAVVIDGTRTMRIAAGTEGKIDCPGLTVPGRCTVAADLLGDAVLWFAIIEGPPAPTIVLPAVEEVLDDGWVRLVNGWEVRHADIVDRVCDDESASLTDFVRTYGATATATFSIETQQVVKVTCPKVTATTTTTTTVADTGPLTSTPLDGGTVPTDSNPSDDEAG